MAHIVHVAKFYPPAVGGIERTVKNMADSARGAGHAVTVVCSAERDGDAGRTTTATGVVVERVATWLTCGSLPISPRLPAALLSAMARADLVHFHEPYPLATLWLAVQPQPRKLVITWHADILGYRLKPVAELLQHRVAGRANAILCASESMLQGSPFLRRHAARTRVVPGEMIDLSPYDEIRGRPERIADTRRQWGGRYILACGRLVPYKGFGVLIDALAGTDMRVVLVGSGGLQGELTAQAHALGVADQICFAGAVDDDTLRNLYCACEFFALPSTGASESFGLVQLEAMAAGRPVINTWLPTSVPEVSLDGVTGLTVPPRDVNALRAAMLQLWTDDRLRERFALAALARVRDQYERSRVRTALLALYDEVIAA